MKQLLPIWSFLLLAVLTACNSRESQEMEAALEQAKAVYGDGNLEIEVDTVLFIPGLSEAPAYFAGKRQYGKAALAALLNGYTEKDFDKEAAMLSFKEAEHYGELAQDSLTMARAEYWMGRMLFYDYMKREALSLFRKSEGFFGCHYSEKALTMNAEACSYLLLHVFDSAEVCLKNSLVLAEMCESEEAKQKALNNYAILYQIQGDFDKAVDYLRMVKPTNDQQTVLNRLNLGRLFMTIGEMDSAAYYFYQMESFLSLDNIKDETMASAYASLSQFAELQGDFTKALKYQKNDKQYLIKVKDRIEKDGVYRIQQQFDFEKMKNEMNEKVIVRQRIILLMSFVVIFVFVALVMLQRRLAKIHKQEIVTKERTLFYVRQYTELLTKQGKTMQKLAIVIDNKEDKALLENLRATVFGRKDPWDALIEVFDILHPNERERIAHQYANLNDMELKDIILSYFNVSRQDEALLLKTGIHSVDKIRISVKRKKQQISEKQ